MTASSNGAYRGNLLNMEHTGRSDRHRGNLYRCKGCGNTFWTCWGNARKHECNPSEDGDHE